MMKIGLQHVTVHSSIRSRAKKGNRMGGLDANWLSADLALVDADVEAWSPGLRESFESLYGESEKETPITEPSDSED